MDFSEILHQIVEFAGKQENFRITNGPKVLEWILCVRERGLKQCQFVCLVK